MDRVEEIETVENELSTKCHSCEGFGKFVKLHEWCISCGGSGLVKTAGRYSLDESKLYMPAPWTTRG